MITRTIYVTTANVYNPIITDGKPDYQYVEVEEMYSTTPTTEKTFRKKFKDKITSTSLIMDLKSEGKIIGMELEDFVKHGVEVTRPASQSK